MKEIKAFAITYLFVFIEQSLAQVPSLSVNNTVEFRNGDTMELICTVTGSCCSSARKWNGGPSFSLLMSDGVTSDSSKYSEIIHSNSFSLLINNMDKSDFLYDYRCTYGFDDSTKSPVSPPGNARYVPAENEIQTISSSTNGDSITFHVNVTTVFPAPSCTANFGGADFTSSMTVTTTDDLPFKFAEISMTNVPYTCPGLLNVSCSVGSYSFHVFNLDPCSGNNEEEFPSWAIIVIAIGTLAILVSPIMICLIIHIRKKRKEKTGSLEHVYVQKDSETELGQTIINEDTTADVVWKKNGNLVIATHSDRTKLKILRATTEDEGIYSCTFGSNNMQLRYSLIVFGTVEIVYVQIGSTIDFGRTIPDEIATAQSTWTKNGKNVTSTHSERTKFKIVNASSEDEGLYVCTFGKNSMQLTFSLIVVGTLEKVYVKKESKKKFGKTIFDKNAIANAEWTKNGEKVNSTYSDRTQFKIDNASVEDEGLYVCTFGSNHMKLKYSLIVVDEIIYAKNGDRIELGKNIQDEHISHSQWTHNGEKVTSLQIDGTKIQIQNALKSDAGLYVCTFEPNTMQLKYQLIIDGSKSKKTKSKLPGGRLTPVENTTYTGRSTLDHKPYGDPLPPVPLTSIPSNQAKKDE